jgi:tRNA threonylcarbamoyl adenosine modification protein YeaZ
MGGIWANALRYMLLSLDTATPYLVLGLPHAERAVRLERRHAEVLWSELEAFLGHHGVEQAALTGLAVGQGPGSYTGLRIGIAAALGLGRGLGIPVVGVDTLQGVAQRYRGRVRVAHTTRNGLCYCASYEVGEATHTVSPPARLKLSELDHSLLLSMDEPPSGRALVRLGEEAIKAGRVGVEAVYL